MERSESSRAAMEPFNGLNTSCPLCEPSSFNQLMAAVLSLIPFGSPKESESIRKSPLVEGEGAQAKSTPGVSFRVFAMYPAAQSPKMVKEASPFTSLSTACCQESPEPSVFAYARTSPNTSHILTALGSVNFSFPDHNAAQWSGPSTPSATDSHN